MIQAEADGGGWVPLVFHDMCNSCADSSVRVATFNAFLDWLQPRAANGTIVKTVRDVVTPAAPSADISVTQTDSPDPVTVGGQRDLHAEGPQRRNQPGGFRDSFRHAAGRYDIRLRGHHAGHLLGHDHGQCNIGTVNPGAVTR